MKNTLSAFALLLLLLCPITALAKGVGSVPTSTLQQPAAAPTPVVRFFNWENYIAPQVLADFTTATGIEVEYNEYDDNSILNARLRSQMVAYDVVVPTAAPYFANQLQAGLYQRLDKSQIPNLKNIDPALQNLLAGIDNAADFGVIYQWGTTGIAYNLAALQKIMPNPPVDSLAIIFNPTYASKFKECGIAVLDSATEIMPLAYRYLGLDPNSTSQSDLQQVEALLAAARPYIKYFHSARPIEDLANGSICLALTWSGDAMQAQADAAALNNGRRIDYNIPVEGSVVWFDVLAIPKAAPNPQHANALINYLLEPHVMAQISNATGYANAVPASWPLLQSQVRDNPSITPPAEVRQKLTMLRQLKPKDIAARNDAWARMRTNLP